MSSDTESELATGLAAHCAGDAAAAVAAYTLVLALAPGHLGAILLHMNALQEQGDWPGAFAQFQRIARSEVAGSVDDVLQLVRLFLAQGRPDLARATTLLVAELFKTEVSAKWTEKIHLAQSAHLTKAGAFAPVPGREVLVVCPGFIDGPQKHALVTYWTASLQRFNPGVDWLLVDDGSAAAEWDALHFSPAVKKSRLLQDAPHAVALDGRFNAVSFPSNIGHPMGGRGKDGPGRSISTGVLTAIAAGYRSVVVLELDMFTRLDLLQVAAAMRAAGRTALSTRVAPWNFIESGFMVFDTAHLAAIAYARRYPWDRVCFFPQPEWVYEAILGEVGIMPWRGGRNDFGQFNDEDITQLDFLTHCHDHGMYRRYAGL